MADEKQTPPQYSLDAKLDACLDLTVRRFVYSSLGGACAGLLFCRLHGGSRNFFSGAANSIVRGSPATIWASLAFGAGIGLGSAFTECNTKFGGFSAKSLPTAVDSHAKSSPTVDSHAESPPVVVSHVPQADDQE